MKAEWEEIFRDPSPVRYDYKGFAWFKKAKCKHALSPLKHVLAARLPDDVTITHRLPSGAMWYANKSPVSLARALPDFDFNLHEMIRTEAPRRAYFDIDYDTNDPDNLEQRFLDLQDKVRASVAGMFGGATVALSGSAGKKKDAWRMSLHIIVGDVVYHDLAHQSECNLDAGAALLGMELGVDVDRSVYSANRAFKLPWQTKGGGDDRVQAILDGSSIEKHFVTEFLPPRSEWREVRFTSLVAPVTREPTPIRRRTDPLPPWPYPVALPDNWNVTGDVGDTLSLLKHTHERPHRFSRRLRYITMTWCKGRGVHFAEFIKWAQQGRVLDEERLARYEQDWRDTNPNKCASNDTILGIMGRLYPDMVIEDSKVRNFLEYTTVPPTEIVALKLCRDGNYRPNIKVKQGVQVWHFPMGSGKTVAVVDQILRDEKAGKRSIIMTCRCALVQDIYATAQRRGSKIASYQNESAASLPRCETVIIQQESLSKLEMAAPYDTVYIDEIESFLNQCASYATHGKRLDLNMRCLVGLLRSAKTIVLIDALVSRKTINFIKALGVKKYDVVTCTAFNPPRRTVRYVSDDKDHAALAEKMAQFIAHKLKNNHNVYYYYPWKSNKYNAKGNRKRYGIEEFNQLVLKMAGQDDIKTLVYWGEMDDPVSNATLQDVNTSWKECRLVGTTSKITVGVSFEPEHFECVVIGKSPNCMPRNLVQTSCRARKLRSNDIFVFSFNGPEREVNVQNHMKPTSPVFKIYESVLEDVQYEMQNCHDQAFRKMCVDAGYEIVDGVDWKFDDAVATEQVEDLSYCWDDIPEPSSSGEFEDLKRSIKARSASTMQKMIYSKAVFKQLFWNEDVAKSAWENNDVAAARTIFNYKNNRGIPLRKLLGNASDFEAFLYNVEDMTEKEVEEAYYAIRDFNAAERAVLSALTLKKDCFSSTTSTKHKRFQKATEVMLGYPLNKYHAKRKRWVMDFEKTYTVADLWEAIADRTQDVELEEFAFIGVE